MTYKELKEQATNAKAVLMESIDRITPEEDSDEIPDELLDGAETDFQQVMDVLMSLRLMLEGERSRRKIVRRVQAGEQF